MIYVETIIRAKVAFLRNSQSPCMILLDLILWQRIPLLIYGTPCFSTSKLYYAEMAKQTIWRKGKAYNKITKNAHW